MPHPFAFGSACKYGVQISNSGLDQPFAVDFTGDAHSVRLSCPTSGNDDGITRALGFVDPPIPTGSYEAYRLTPADCTEMSNLCAGYFGNDLLYFVG